jgi:hypothetical protein
MADSGLCGAFAFRVRQRVSSRARAPRRWCIHSERQSGGDDHQGAPRSAGRVSASRIASAQSAIHARPQQHGSTERRRSRTYRAVGCTTAPVLKTSGETACLQGKIRMRTARAPARAPVLWRRLSSTPSLPRAPIGNWSQPVATVLAYQSRFRGSRICHRLPMVAPARLHERSIFVAGISDEKADSATAFSPARG